MRQETKRRRAEERQGMILSVVFLVTITVMVISFVSYMRDEGRHVQKMHDISVVRGAQ